MTDPALRRLRRARWSVGRCASLLVLVFWLDACGGTPVAESPAQDDAAGKADTAGNPPAAARAAPAPGAMADPTATADGAKPAQIEFFDSSSFDDDLSAALGHSPAKLDVIPLERFGLNQVPPRLGKWLAKVKDSGGKVQARAIVPENAVASRAIIGLAADLVVAVYDHIRDSVVYSAAKQYDAVLWYRRETGSVERVSFIARSAQ